MPSEAGVFRPEITEQDAERAGIGYGESVEEALCFGWIDSLVRGIDDETYARRFTQRRPDSKWSEANTERVDAMIEAGKMTPAGMELVDAAKESGEWAKAYRLGANHELPADLEVALRENDTAWENFQGFSNTDQFAFIAAVEEAKTDETRRRRIERTVDIAVTHHSPTRRRFDRDEDLLHPRLSRR